MIINNQFKRRKQIGFTLVELLVYISVLTVISAAIVSFFFWAIKTNAKSRTAAEVSDNARRAMEIMVYEIRQATGVYTPTSIFDANPGQLSLETKINPLNNETKTYEDFYLADNKLYLKKEGTAAEQITSDQVRVSNLVFKYIGASGNLANVQIELKVEDNDSSNRPEFQAEINLISSATLRGY